MALFDLLQRLEAVVGHDHLEPGRLERVGDDPHHLRFVVRDQHCGLLFHVALLVLSNGKVK